MDTKTLAIFVECYRSQSFAAVARARNVNPAAISRAIAQLEAELACKLFLRNTRKIEATTAGKRYFEHIAPLLEQLDFAAEQLQQEARTASGSLRVTASVSFGLHLLQPALHSFMQQYPSINIELLLNDNVVDIVEDRIDLAIRHGKLEDSALIAKPLLQTDYALCASPAYLAHGPTLSTLDDLAHHKLLSFNFSAFSKAWLFTDKHSAQQTKINIQAYAKMNNALALKASCIAGLGIALLPTWLVQSECEQGTLQPQLTQHKIQGVHAHSTIYTVYASRQFLPHKLKLLLTFLHEHFQA